MPPMVVRQAVRIPERISFIIATLSFLTRLKYKFEPIDSVKVKHVATIVESIRLKVIYEGSPESLVSMAVTRCPK